MKTAAVLVTLLAGAQAFVPQMNAQPSFIDKLRSGIGASSLGFKTWVEYGSDRGIAALAAHKEDMVGAPTKQVFDFETDVRVEGPDLLIEEPSAPHAVKIPAAAQRGDTQDCNRRKHLLSAGAAVLLAALPAPALAWPPKGPNPFKVKSLQQVADARPNGSPDSGPRSEREALADDIDYMMIEHYMKAYFPKIIDKEGGGVYMYFDRQFNPTSSSKNLNILSRHLFSASMAALMHPEYAGLRESADKIFEFIRDKWWDKANGGSAIHAGSGDGQIVPVCDKPLYHNGFALVGLAAYCLATKDPTALDMAISTWKWIESKAYDTEYGMYYGWLNADGSLAGGNKRKNQDVLHHWIEGMAWLYIAWPPGRSDAADRELLKKRVKESADIFTGDRWIRKDGSIILDNNREMTCGIGTNVGLDAEDVYLFYFYYLAIDMVPPQAAIDNLKKVHAYVRTRSKPGSHFASQWWPDAELFTSYCSMAINFNAGDSYLQDCKTHWEYIKAHYFDPQYGGWYREPDATNSSKGDEWQCTYHGFKCMLFARNMLYGSQKGWIDPRPTQPHPPHACAK